MPGTILRGRAAAKKNVATIKETKAARIEVLPITKSMPKMFNVVYGSRKKISAFGAGKPQPEFRCGVTGQELSPLNLTTLIAGLSSGHS